MGRISIDEFASVDLRVGTVTAAEEVPGATKLVKLEVRLGPDDSRQLVAGVREYLAPDQLVGRRVVVVANLEPARIRGIQSDGMVLAAVTDGQLSLVTVDGDIPDGARVR